MRSPALRLPARENPSGPLLLKEEILGRESPWSTLYDPAHLSLRALGRFVSKNTKTSLPYADWLSGSDVGFVEEITAGEGAVLRDGAGKVAVYRDPRGEPHFFPATCPHLGGIVRWNAAEKTWDCPCHGSRFSRLGQVLNGPACVGLRQIEGARVREQDAASA